MHMRRLQFQVDSFIDCRRESYRFNGGFRLLDLASGIQERILKFAFGSSKPIPVPTIAPSSNYLPHMEPGALLACRELHEKGQKTFWGVNEFEVASLAQAKQLVRLLQKRGKLPAHLSLRTKGIITGIEGAAKWVKQATDVKIHAPGMFLKTLARLPDGTLRLTNDPLGFLSQDLSLFKAPQKPAKPAKPAKKRKAATLLDNENAAPPTELGESDREHAKRQKHAHQDGDNDVAGILDHLERGGLGKNAAKAGRDKPNEPGEDGAASRSDNVQKDDNGNNDAA